MEIRSLPILSSSAPQPAPLAQSPQFDVVDKIATDTLRSAGTESTWEYCYTRAGTGLRAAQTVAAGLPGSTPAEWEKSQDLIQLVDSAVRFADRQHAYFVRGPILLQALDDAAIIARGSSQPSEKLDDVGAIVASAQGRFGQDRWDQACGVAMQALNDVQLVAQHHDPAVSDKETVLLGVADRMAADALERADREYDAEHAGPVLSAGLRDIKAALQP